jgi:arginyl-tRNA synthetase
MNIRIHLEKKFQDAMRDAGVSAEFSPMIRLSARREFGDYQANGIMPAAKSMKANPRDVAARVLEQLEWQSFASKVEIAGPGFINIFLKNDWLGEATTLALASSRLGIPTAEKPKRVVVDYSSPNLAKEMHVGHLRSTIIGDVLSRVEEFLGHNVIRQNHVGDWGTQFGMLLAHLEDVQKSCGEKTAVELADLEAFYIAAKRRFDEDKTFEERARQTVVKFQAGDAAALRSLSMFIETSLTHCEEIYDRLNIGLKRSDVRGESAYNEKLPGVVESLRRQQLLVEDQGAQCVFMEEFKGKDGPLPIIVQKSDGGYLYMTTDLAALSYRSQTLGADDIIVVTDARQALHFKQVEALGRRAGFLPPSTALRHVAFGMVLGNDNKPFKTRDGGTVKLFDLLSEAEERALALVREKNSDLPDEELRKIAHAVGVGAVKYADLSKHRISDYVFSWDQMLSFEGNTAPYLLYAYTRIAGILRKAGTSVEEMAAGAVTVAAPQERTLALQLLQFSETLNAVSAELLPHYLCTYLYDLAGAFMSFYEACPVLGAAGEERESRMRLAALTARTLQRGLGLLGLKTLERM